MQTGEALKLLSAGLPPDHVARERANLATLAARLGKWAQLLKIVNGFLRDRVVLAHEPLSVAIRDFREQLDDEGPFSLSIRATTRPTAPRPSGSHDRPQPRTALPSPSAYASANLPSFQRTLSQIPFGIVARLWSAAGGLKEYKTKALLGRLFDLSLLLGFDLDMGARFFRLHDTTRHFLRGSRREGGPCPQTAQATCFSRSRWGRQTWRRDPTRGLDVTITCTCPIIWLKRTSESGLARCCSIQAGSRRSSRRHPRQSRGAGFRLRALRRGRGARSHRPHAAADSRYMCARSAPAHTSSSSWRPAGDATKRSLHEQRGSPSNAACRLLQPSVDCGEGLAFELDASWRRGRPPRRPLRCGHRAVRAARLPPRRGLR